MIQRKKKIESIVQATKLFVNKKSIGKLWIDYFKIILVYLWGFKIVQIKKK